MTFISRGGIEKARARQREEIKDEQQYQKYRRQGLGSATVGAPMEDTSEGHLGKSRRSDLTDLFSIVRGIFRLFG